MICPSCGTTVPDHYKFCIKCGSRLEAIAGKSPNPAARHFSLEDIARQQNEKNASQIGLKPAEPSSVSTTPPPQQPTTAVTTALHPAGPAVPLGAQSQVCFSIFSDEAAVKMQEIENKKI